MLRTVLTTDVTTDVTTARPTTGDPLVRPVGVEGSVDAAGAPGHPATGRPGPLLDRLRHVVVDGAVLLLLLLPAAVVGVLAGLLDDVPAAVPAVAALAAVGTALTGSLVAWPHHDGGRTVGMRRVGLRVVAADGPAPSCGALAVRALLLPVDLLVGWPLVLLRQDRRRIGDLVAGTRVVPDVARPR